MTPQRTGKSTIKNDPFESLIPTGPPAEDRRPRAEGRRATQSATPPPPAPPAAEPVPAGEAPEPPPAGPDAKPSEPPAVAEGRQKLTVHLDADVVNRVKNAAYWNPRLTIARIAERGIRLALKEVERDHGGAYPQREGELVGGRPIK